MFRGNPRLTGVTDSRMASNPILRWTFKTGSEVKSSAAIVDGRVFFGSGDSNCYCLKLETGSKLWSFAADGPIDSSPLVLDGRVYFGTANTNFYCIDAKNGKEIWRYGLDEKVLSSPNWIQLPEGNRKQVLVGCYDFNLYAFDAANGKTNWVYSTGNYINGSPAIGDGVTAFGEIGRAHD